MRWPSRLFNATIVDPCAGDGEAIFTLRALWQEQIDRALAERGESRRRWDPEIKVLACELERERARALDPLACADFDADLCDDCASGAVDPSADGLDLDGDGLCNAGDPDADGDGVLGPADSSPLDPLACHDLDGDACDDCASGLDNPLTDGPDFEHDGLCDAGDLDDDNDGVPDSHDSAPRSPFACRDADSDGCDDCTGGSDNPADDGPDFERDGLCDAGDLDDDNDGVLDFADEEPLSTLECRDADADTCDDCTSGHDDPLADGPDGDGDGACDAGDLCPLHEADATLSIRAERHTVGSGSHPASTKQPLVGLPVGIYAKGSGSCAVATCGGTSWQHYACIVQTCQAVQSGATNGAGQVIFHLAPGDYLAIGGDGSDKHLGTPSGLLACGDQVQKYLQQIVKADGKTVPGKTSVRTGSRLLIIEPEVTEWTTTTELYPVIFESEGDWNAEATVTPPEGFVADHESLSEQVTDELEAVQFTLTDVGSDWVPTEIRHVLRHHGRREILLSRIGVLLSSELAAAKQVDREGHPLGPDGHPLPHAGFDPRHFGLAGIVGWIEPSAVDAMWTIKLRVEVAGVLNLAITRGQGAVVQQLADGSFEPGEYAFTWNGAGGQGQYFVRLIAGQKVEKVKLVDR